MKAVFLDRVSLDRGDLDLTGVEQAVDHLESHDLTAPDEVIERLRNADIAIVNKVVLGREVFAECPNLRLVCVVATGTNNVDLEAAAESDVTVCNCRGYGPDTLSQHVLSLILALSRSLPDYSQAVRDGAWSRSPIFCLLDYPIREIQGRTLGIIGYGELGQAAGRICEAVGMNVIVAERPGREEARSGRVLIPDLLSRSDVVTVHCPLTTETRGLIGREELARMKPDALLINTARGGIVDEQALADALRAGHLGGAGVDVLTSEPPAEDNPLLAGDIPRLIVTPHCAWGSHDARQAIVDQTIENVASWREGAPVRTVTP